jgi:nickel-type superoxide dismutase maturation protease
MQLALVATALVGWVLERVEVHGSSMSPTFEPGDRLLLVRRFRALRPGDLVSLDDPRDGGRRLIKRVTAVKGAFVEVHGDNLAASTDSRDFGEVPARSVRHLVVRKYASSPSS